MNKRGSIAIIVIIVLLVIIVGILSYIYFIKPNINPVASCGNGKCEKGEDVKNCASDCRGTKVNQTKPPVDNTKLNQTKPSVDNQTTLTPTKNPSPSGNLSAYEDSPFGLSMAFNEVELRIALDIGYSDALSPTSYYLNDLGIKWVRPVMFWDLVENEFCYLNFSFWDDQARGMYAQGVKSIQGFDPNSYYDNQICHSSSCAMPCDEDDYTNFIRKTVERYDGDSDYGC